MVILFTIPCLFYRISTMKFKTILFSIVVVGLCTNAIAQQKEMSGNPIFPGWNADPEAKIFKGEYWVYPTYSAPYKDQVHMDAWSSKDLVHWVKHPDIIDTSAVKWAKKAMWAPAVTEMGRQILFLFRSE